jgi:hypothetical protein
VRLLSQTLVAAAALIVSASAAQAATIIYQGFPHTSVDFRADLGGVTPVLPDAFVIFNEYNFAPTLPAGLPLGYDIEIPATFIGDGNVATADAFDDRFLFKIDLATTGGAGTTTADNYFNLIVGPNTGFDNSTFAIFENQNDGDLAGPALASRTGSGQLLVGLDTSLDYILRVTGNLRADNPNTLGNESTNSGAYSIVLSLSPVPIPPALLLLVTAMGAMFGFGKLKRRSALGGGVTA